MRNNKSIWKNDRKLQSVNKRRAPIKTPAWNKRRVHQAKFEINIIERISEIWRKRDETKHALTCKVYVIKLPGEIPTQLSVLLKFD